MRMIRIRVWRPNKKLRLSQVVSMGAKKEARSRQGRASIKLLGEKGYKRFLTA